MGTPQHETFTYDALDRLEDAQTYLSGSLSRTLTTSYDRLGNIQSKTSDVAGDPDVTGYQYGTTPNAGPHAVSAANLNGIATTFAYDANGNVTEYQAATGDHKYLEWNVRNLPEMIVVGDSRTDPTPTAREDFYYGPDGERYYKQSVWQVGTDQHIEHTFYVGSFEEIIPEDVPGVTEDLTQVKKTQVTGNVLHVKTTDPLLQETEAIEYLHRDHLGSVERITDANGLELPVLAYDPFGERRNSDWVGAIDATEFDALLAEMNVRTSRGFTGHEHLDRTGIIHMNGRIYDPQLGRFLSPDPFVPQPTFSQSWNRYSYVLNNPLSYTDPSGYAETSASDDNPFLVYTGYHGGLRIGLFQKEIPSDILVESRNLLGHFMQNGRTIPSMMIGGHTVFETAMAREFRETAPDSERIDQIKDRLSGDDDLEETLELWIDHYKTLWRNKGDVIRSIGAIELLILDVTGILGKFGRHDTFDPSILDAIINSHPNAGKPGPSADENFWDNIHGMSGTILARIGLDRESAINILRDWERIEPVIWSGWHPNHQGRNLFEGGQEGIDRDMITGMQGYDWERAIQHE